MLQSWAGGRALGSRASGCTEVGARSAGAFLMRPIVCALELWRPLRHPKDDTHGVLLRSRSAKGQLISVAELD